MTMPTLPSEPITSGAVLGGKYRLSHPIGFGSMGTVWAAVNQTTSREVAVKLLLGSSPDLLHRFQREARSLGALKHPNIIDIYDAMETESGEPFLVMELLSGETLAQLLAQRRRLESIEAARIALQVARALAAAHTLGIVHRDLKPANIFLHVPPGAADPIVKVLDFGVAKRVGGDDGFRTVAGGLVGSPAYMSPEQARADRTIEHRSDIWSLGVVLFQMLTGVLPFTGESPELLEKIGAGPIPTVAERIRNADPRLNDLVARCLERDRDERLGAASEIAQILESVVSQKTAAAAAPPPPRSPCSSRPDAIGQDEGTASRSDAAVFVGPPSSRAPAIPPAPSPALSPMDECDAATVRCDFRKMADLVRQVAPPGLHALPEMTPRGTVKMSAADVLQLHPPKGAALPTPISTTAPLVLSGIVPAVKSAPPVSSIKSAPAPSAAPRCAASARAIPSRGEGFALRVLVGAAVTTSLGLLLLAALYFAIYATSADAPATGSLVVPESSALPPAAASSSMPRMTPVVSAPSAGAPPSSASSVALAPGPSVSGPPAPSTAPAREAKPPPRPAAPLGATQSTPSPRPPRDCSKLRFIAREKCLKGDRF
jgi:serine/threonine-protein kinase